jgi:transitional endoplasmic reticulum ATPase
MLQAGAQFRAPIRSEVFTMAKTLNEAVGKYVHAEIVRAGEALTLPEGMTIKQAVELLKAREAYDDETTIVRRTVNCFPWDGAYALAKVLEKKYGWANAIPTPGFFGPEPPQLIDIPTGVGKTTSVPWGRMSLPRIDGFVQTDTGTANDGRRVLALVASIKRKHEAEIKQLFDAVEAYVKTDSLYRGKAVTMRFRDSDGDALSMPSLDFVDVAGIGRNTAIYNEDVSRALDVSLWTPIERAQDCIANGVSLKRGVLLGGMYGTGKTLGMTVAAALAQAKGITYVHVQRADELAQAILFARQYQSPAAVVACEDIDRTTDGERTVEMDDLLNTIDGIDGKNTNILVVLTTNHMENINPAMLRPGRLDAVIEVSPPDAVTVQRLIRAYLGLSLPADADITEAGTVLAGQIPAVVAEVCKRAKLAQLLEQEPGTKVRNLSAAAVILAAQTMGHQLELLRKVMAKPAAAPTIDSALREIVAQAGGGGSESATRSQASVILQKVDDTRQRIAKMTAGVEVQTEMHKLLQDTHKRVARHLPLN